MAVRPGSHTHVLRCVVRPGRSVQPPYTFGCVRQTPGNLVLRLRKKNGAPVDMIGAPICVQQPLVECETRIDIWISLRGGLGAIGIGIAKAYRGVKVVTAIVE